MSTLRHAEKSVGAKKTREKKREEKRREEKRTDLPTRSG
jgi:hypothetical protein